MKKLLFTLVLGSLVTFSFAQKKVVSSAKNELKGTPNFEQARSLIKGALTDPETANSAEAWYVAGQIEEKQFDLERTNEMLGKQQDQKAMYTALSNIYPYFEKAYELDNLPDEKGRVRPKYTKDIKSSMVANRIYYINAGVYFYDNKEYKKAYENFRFYGEIPSLPMMVGEVFPATNDSTDMQVLYYAGLAASLNQDHKDAIDVYLQLKDKQYMEKDVLQKLAYEYEQINDSASWEKTLVEGATKFPTEDYFVLNLINLSIGTGNTEQAVKALETAIANEPDNAQYYDVLGQLYEGEKKIDEAIKYFEKAIELDPNYMEAILHIGRVYFNLGVEVRSKADDIDIKEEAKYRAEIEKSKEHFRKAMPFFQKIYEKEPDNMNAIYALRSIYYNLNMGDEFDKIDEVYKKLEQ